MPGSISNVWLGLRRMARFWFLLPGMLLLAACAPTVQPVQPAPRQTLRVVMDNAYPPYTFLGGDGQLQGILVDQWHLFQQKTGIAVEIHAMDWAEALKRMQAGEFDAIDTIFENDTRVQLYDFTAPYARLDVPIFFSENIAGIHAASDLKGFLVAVKSGDAAIEYLKSQGVEQLLEFNSYEAIINAAKDQKVIVFVADQPPALHYLYKQGIQDQFHYTQPLYSGEFHRAVRKGNQALLQTLEQGFALISSAEYAAIDRKWSGQSVVSPQLWGTLGIVGAAIVVFLLLLLGWNTTLRRRVAGQTRDLRRALENLGRSEQKYRQLVANLPGVVYRCAPGPDWSFLYLSDDVTGFGYSPADWVERPGRGLFSMVALPDRAAALQAIEHGIQVDGKFTADLRLVTASGALCWVSNRGQAVFNGQNALEWVDGVILDVTERKLAEQALRDREDEAQRFSRLMANLTRVSMELAVAPNLDELFRLAVERGIAQLGFERMGIWLVDESDPRYILGTFGVDEQGCLRDERMRRILVDPADSSGRILLGQAPLIFEKRQALVNDDSRVVGSGERAAAAIWDGRVVMGFVSIDNLLSETNIDSAHREAIMLYAQVVGHLFSLKKTEAALRQLNAELEERVQQRTAQLEASYAEMQSFSYSISHDLRAPLRTLNSFSQILEEEYFAALDPQARDYLSRIRAASTHMSHLMDALLKLARISRSEIQRMPVSLSGMAREIADNLQADQPQRQVEWHIADGLDGLADPALMRVVLENLLGNAWKFTAKRASAQISVGGEQQEGRMVYFVRDNGAGFDMNYANKLFGAFQRLHTSAEFEGTGIGLAIVQRIVRRHGGEIWAQGGVEQGATFSFALMPAA